MSDALLVVVSFIVAGVSLVWAIHRFISNSMTRDELKFEMRCGRVDNVRLIIELERDRLPKRYIEAAERWIRAREENRNG